MRWVGESPCGRPTHDPAPSGYVAVPDPYTVRVVRMGAGGPGPLWGSGPRWSARSFPFLRHVASPDPSPGGGRSGAVGLVREMPGPWDLATPSFHAVTDNYTGPALLQ